VEATKVLWQLFQQSEAFRNEFKDYKVFLMYSADMGEFWNNTRPIKTPADCAGLNLRTPGAMTERTMRALGLGAVNMPMPDVYDNIDRGVIQGLAVGPSAIPTYHLEEVVSYGTNGLNLFASPQMMCMSWDAWNKLSPDLQALFDSLTGEAFWIKAATIYDEMGASSRKGITGVEYYELTAADKAAFTTATAGVVDEYLAELNGKGYDGNAFYNLMISIRDGIR
jgi:TRAP-type C4-dicarboxylate transport system substrate-binding protein